ncbi:MAG: 50S ribosomal protein L18 [Legionella sp.]|nr:50S ribosomal protein L18 [Legionella sp.]
MLNKRNARVRRGLRAKKEIHVRLERQKMLESASLHRPRLVVYRSNANIYAQIVMPNVKGDQILVAASTLDKELKPSLSGNKVNHAAEVGKLLGRRAKAKDISQVSFDRSGYKYHGRIKSLADGAREEGLNF